MIRKLVKITLLLLLVVGGGWGLFHRTEISSFQDAMSLLKQDGSRLISSIQNVSFSSSTHSAPGRIRIASFDLHDFSDGKLDRTNTAKTLVSILSQFDVVAVQGIQSPDHDTLPRLMDYLRQVNPNYDYVIGPKSSHTALDHQFAFVYNRQTIELDRQRVYTVQDPDDVISHDPLVGWFRVQGNEEKAFTFTLVNLKVDASNKSIELGYLQNIKLAVKSDGHHEDDILLIGNFQENSINMLNRKVLTGYDFVIRQQNTDLVGQHQLSNLGFPVQATAEFTGRTGVVDFLTEGNLSLKDANEVSKHLPIWAEFMSVESTSASYADQASKQ